MTINFDNTEVAFSGMTNKDLKRSYWLFKVIGWNWLIKISPFLLKVFLPLYFPIPLIRATIFKQFCGGESIEGCRSSINQLGKSNIKTILDYSVEGKAEESVFNDNVTETIKAIETAKGDDNIPFSVFKPTGFGRFELFQKINSNQNLTATEEKEYERVVGRIDMICKRASDLSVPVFIDAEETWIQDPIDEIAINMMRKYNGKEVIVYNTAQMYRKDRLAYLKELLAIAENEDFLLGLKLVRGAYIEKERARAEKMGYEDPMQKTKADTDKDFDLGIQFCMNNIDRISFCCASHNEKSNLLLAKLMSEKGIATDDKRVYFAQLLGMSDHISKNMAKANFNVAKYVPYGPVKDVTPYLIRRAEENTSIAGQTGRELSLILKELDRRKSK